MYDLNMKEIKFPEGLMPLDIFVGSIAKERATETIEGRSGIVDYGTNYVDRSVELSMWINSSDTTDYRLLRNELYALFDTGNAFYIEETRVPSRVLKVAVDESFIPDRLTIRNASVDVTCRTLDSVFWESKYTTLELHDSGYSATAEKYGLVDNIDDEKVQYRFEGAPYNENLMSAPYDYRSPLDSPFRIILSDGLPAGDYTISFDYEVLSGNPSGFLVFSGSTLATVTPTGGRVSANFSISSGNEYTGIRLYGDTGALASRSTDVLFKDIKIESGDQATPFDDLSTKFSVYNAGNVTIEPESMYLHIIANTVTTSGGFTITNKTTDEEFVFNEEINGQSILLKGMDVRVSSIYNRFRDTNRRFISLAPGDNKIEVSGGTFNHIRFDFRYLYK